MHNLLHYLRGPVDPAISAVLAAFDMEYALTIARQLAAIGTYERGFRPAGSRACAAAAEMLTNEIRALGLVPEVERFTLDGWEFAGALVETGADRIEAVAYGGTVGTPPDGIAGRLVRAGSGSAADYVGTNPEGAIALVGIDYDRMNWSRIVALEAMHQGAVAVICYPLNSFAQAEGALHSHDGQAVPGLPMVNISRRDGERLMAGAADWVRIVSSAQVIPGAEGRNLVATIPGGDLAHEQIIIGDHYDAWFHGFLDDAVGVAAVLGLAKAVIDAGYQPRRTLRFVLHDAEEYGAVDSPWDWCVGAWAQIARLRPEWQESTVAAVIFELCGFKEAAEFVWYASPDMLATAERVMAQLEPHRVYPDGYRIIPQVTAWEDAWSYTACGVPTVANLELPPSFMERYYHTQFDTEALFDPTRFGLHVAGLGLLALMLDRQERFVPDLGARARQMRTSLGGLAAPAVRGLLDELEAAAGRLEAAAGRLEAATGRPEAAGAAPEQRRPAGEAGARAATTVLNRGLTWLGGDGSDETLYPHEQPARDLAALDAALGALGREEVAGAQGALERVTGMAWGRHVSYKTYRAHLFIQEEQPGRDWLWATGRVSPYLDIWHQWHRPDLGALVALREQAVANLEAALRHEEAVLREALALLR